MHALTILAPYAQAILYGPKRIENRRWRPKLHPGEPLAIHVGKSPRLIDDPGIFGEISDLWPDALRIRDWQLGTVIGTVTYLGCVHVDRHVQGTVSMYDSSGTRDWICGPYCWQLGDPKILREPFACRGRQGLFSIDDPRLREHVEPQPSFEQLLAFFAGHTSAAPHDHTPHGQPDSASSQADDLFSMQNNRGQL